jgi:hypothetical protein
LLCDIQHLVLFASYLSDEGTLDEFDFFNYYAQKYESMIMADRNGRLGFYAITLESFNFNSPPEIKVGVKTKSKTLKRFKEVFSALRNLIAIKSYLRQQEAKADHMEADAERARHKAMGEAMKNADLGLKIATRIRNPEMRKLFEANLLKAIDPFVDGRHPPLRLLEIEKSGEDNE